MKNMYIKRKKRGRGYRSVVEYFISMYEVLMGKGQGDH